MRCYIRPENYRSTIMPKALEQMDRLETIAEVKRLRALNSKIRKVNKELVAQSMIHHQIYAEDNNGGGYIDIKINERFPDEAFVEVGRCCVVRCSSKMRVGMLAAALEYGLTQDPAKVFEALHESGQFVEGLVASVEEV